MRGILRYFPLNSFRESVTLYFSEVEFPISVQW